MGIKIIEFRPKGDHEWTGKASCAAPGAVSMFPHDGDEVGQAAAKRQCVGCPVRQTCLDEAMARGESWGVWGGLTTDERRGLRRRQVAEQLDLAAGQLDGAA